MTRRRKLFIGLISCAFAVLILLIAVVVIAPIAVDTPMVKAWVHSELKKATGIEIDFEHLILKFFPHLQIIIGRVDLANPPGVKGKAAAVTVQPEILPLFLGKVQIAGLLLDSAELDYILPQKPAKAKTTPHPFSLYDLGKRIQAVVANLPEFTIPDLDFRVDTSSVNLFAGDRKFLELTEVNSHLEGPPERRKIKISSKSSLWQRASISVLLNTKTYKGGGQVQLTQFRPQGLLTHLFPDSSIRITEAPVNLTIDFKSDEPGQMQADLNSGR